MNIKRKNLFTAHKALRLENPGYSYCHCCGIPWNLCNSKSVKTSDKSGTFATCQTCWDESSLSELIEYYTACYNDQEISLKNLNFETGSKYEMKHSLVHLLNCVKDEFNKTRKINIMTTENLNFGQAIEAAKQGKRVARKGWNGSGMFAYIVPAAEYPAKTMVAQSIWGKDGKVPYREYWALKTAQNDVAPWAPSGSDSLAEDWVILED